MSASATSPLDEERLAEAYERALSLEKSGKREAAIVAWQEVLALDPADHGGASIRLAALGALAAPKRMPDAYVTTLFDQHAQTFDNILVDQLGYGVPLILAEVLRSHAPGPYRRGLDLGCGTGLGGEALESMVETMIGLDISEEMVALADERECYEELYIAEAEDFLENIGEEEPPFDLIIATDVLPYIGDVSRLLTGMAAKINPEGVVGFSTEAIDGNGSDNGYHVLPTHRYAHDPSYIEQELSNCGFEKLFGKEIVVRMEKNQPAPGNLFLAKKS